MPNTRSGASRTREGVNEQISCQMAGALGARNAAKNLEPLMRDGGEHEEMEEMEMEEMEMKEMEMVMGTKEEMEGVVGLTRWFEKMETVFYISNCLEKYQVKKWSKDGTRCEIGCCKDDLTALPEISGIVVVVELEMVPNEGIKLRDSLRVACQYSRKWPCTVRCVNCKRVSHITRDCTAIVTPNTQRALVGNQPGIVYYECGMPGHFRKDCPKLRNQNRRNKTGNKSGNKTGNQTGSNEATAKALP
ncbi:putative reverse transcriptase domain-containing protein [Tanacetum coccineum]